MSFDLSQLLNYLHTEENGALQFIGKILPAERRNVFGGQVLAQALDAAIRTTASDRQAHSLHGHFLRSGNPAYPIQYVVDVLRDGRSFSTRLVTALQADKPIFHATVSFQKPEGGMSHQQSCPDMMSRDEMISEFDYWQKLRKQRPELALLRPNDFSAMEVLSNFRTDFESPKAGNPRQHFWLKANGELPKNSNDHLLILAFMSDMHLMTTAMRAHPVTHANEGLLAASLDHALWFYEGIDTCEWLYYDMQSPVSANGRGLNHGNFYTESGKLVAAVSQEGLIRWRS